MADAGWTAIGLAIGTYINWLIVAKRLRTYSNRCNNSITIPDFFSNRYRDDKHFLMGIAAVIILIFFVPYTASGFAACGKLFQTLFNMDYHIAMILSAVIIISYTSIGGFLAASTTDLLQSIVMTIALVILVCFGVSTAGGFGAVIDNAESLAGYLSLTHLHDVTTGGATNYSFLSIISTLAWGLGYFGMPHILLRFMAIEDSRKIKTSRRIASVWVVISMGIAIFIGLIGNTLSANGSIAGSERQFRSRNSCHENCNPTERTWCRSCPLCRSDFCWYSCLHHVHLRLTAAGGFLQFVRKSAAWCIQNQAD